MKLRPTLGQLSANLEPLPEGVDEATALIATTNPKALVRAADMSIVTGIKLGFRADDGIAELYENRLEDSLEHPSIFRDGHATRKLLEAALADQQFAQVVHDGLAPEIDLAQEVHAQRTKLSRPARYVATAMCALAVGGAATGFLYGTMEASSQRAAQDTIEYNQSKPAAEQIPATSGKLENGDYAFIGLVGGLITAAGASMGALASDSLLTGRVSRRRAKRQLKQAQETQPTES